MEEAVIVIPARHASARFPGKPLAMIRGADGQARSLLERSVMAARAAAAETPGVTGVFVATDDDRIAAEAARIGARVILTDAACANGTERVAQAVERAGLSQPIVINLQGDAPLTPPHFVAALVEAMRAPARPDMATPILRCDAAALENFRADRRAGRVGATTVVRDLAGNALYFSKEILPFSDAIPADGEIPVFHHVGLYAYRQAALRRYASLPPGPLERIEGLEQLRFMEHGDRIATVEVDARGAVFWEVNNPEDIARVEAALRGGE